MNRKLIAASMIALFVAGTVSAQDTDKKEKRTKEERIIIKKKTDGKKEEKMTIEIDGDKVTINGKPIEDLKDEDIEVIRGKAGAFALAAPHMAELKGMGDMNFSFDSDDFPMAQAFGSGSKSNKAFLGVVTDKTEQGAKITNITKESAAEKAGLKEGDIITKVGETKIDEGNGLYEVIGKSNPEDKVEITYLRDGKENKTTATLGKNKESRVYSWNNSNNNFNFERPVTVRGFPTRKPKLGMQIQDVEEGTGVKVLDVDEETPAAKAGLQKDDIIIELNDKEIKTTDDAKLQLKDVKEGDIFKLKYKRDGKTKTTELKYPRKLKTVDL